jgi:hypothetical protein
MQKGSVLSVNDPEGIIRGFPGDLYGVQAANTHLLLRELRSYSGTDTCFAFGDALHVTFKEDQPTAANDRPADNSAAAALLPYLNSKGLNDARLEKITPGIEDCFIHLLND